MPQKKCSCPSMLEHTSWIHIHSHAQQQSTQTHTRAGRDGADTNGNTSDDIEENKGRMGKGRSPTTYSKASQSHMGERHTTCAGYNRKRANTETERTKQAYIQLIYRTLTARQKNIAHSSTAAAHAQSNCLSHPPRHVYYYSLPPPAPPPLPLPLSLQLLMKRESPTAAYSKQAQHTRKRVEIRSGQARNRTRRYASNARANTFGSGQNYRHREQNKRTNGQHMVRSLTLPLPCTLAPTLSNFLLVNA